MNVEDKYVKQFYNVNVKKFSESRYNTWPPVKIFIESIKTNSNVCDIGCGNGKNQYRKDLNYLSCDNSIEMCKLVKNSVCTDCTNLPFQTDSFDAVICIAVIHHLSSFERRLLALQEIRRILKPGCKGLISVWGNQPKYGEGDQIIGWNLKENQRYIHFFSHTEINDLISSVFKKYFIEYDYNNYYITVY